MEFPHADDPEEDGMAVDEFEGLDPHLQRSTAADKRERAEARVAKNPMDIDAWNSLVVDAQAKGIEATRPIFERVLKALPTAVRYWKMYIDQELKVRNFALVEQIFGRCLLSCPNVEIWRLYLNYVRSPKENVPTSRDEVTKAFEFALEHIGMDIHSAPIWNEYIAFLKADEPPIAEREMRQNAIRRVYQRACELPIHDVERIWRDYEAWEGVLLGTMNNRQTLKLVLGDMIPKFTSARAVYKEKKALYDGLVTNALPRPPRSSAREDHQAQLWQRLLAYERTNPQRLDAAVLRTRVSFAYNQSLLCLYFYPNIWYEFAAWLAESGAGEQALQVYDRALVAIPNSLILHFAKADYLEMAQQLPAAENVYINLTQQKPDPLVWIQYMKFARRAKGAAAARQVFLTAKKSEQITFHVFVASALTEFYLNKDSKVARNIFELGLKTYSNEPAYIRQYATFLTHLSEENNLRVLYERALSSLPSDKAIEIWNDFYDFENLVSDLGTVTKMEKRRLAAYPDNEAFTGMLSLVQRYKFLDLIPCSASELESFARPDERKSRGGGRDFGAPTSGTVKGFARPDLSQMIIYKAEMGLTGNPRAGNGLAFTPATWPGVPEALLKFASTVHAALLPGPPLDPDGVLMVMAETPMPPPPPTAAAPEPSKKEQRSRRKGHGEGSEEEDDDTAAPLTNSGEDVFKSRQAAKMRKKT